MLEGKDPRGAAIHIGETGKLQHRHDMGLIFRPYRTHAVAVGEIVIAIGQPQTTLQKVRSVTS